MDVNCSRESYEKWTGLAFIEWGKPTRRNDMTKERRYRFTFNVVGLEYYATATSEAEAYANAVNQLKTDLKNHQDIRMALVDITGGKRKNT